MPLRHAALALAFLALAPFSPAAAGDLPRTDNEEIARTWPGAPPPPRPSAEIIVRPWQEFVAVRREAEQMVMTNPREIVRFLDARLGPLPWRFDPDARTPFTSPLVIERVDEVTETGDFGGRAGVWARGRYLRDDATVRESFLIGPIVEANNAHVMSMERERRERAQAMHDVEKYSSGVYRDLSGYPRPLYGYHYGNPALGARR